MRVLFFAFRLLKLLSACLLLVACSWRVVETLPMDPGDLSSPPCDSALGYYFLPKALLSLNAQVDPSFSPPAMTATLSPSITTVADRTQAFCLDYLSSPVSKDVVTVQRGDNFLLQSINSNVEDRTPQIATALIQTAENLAIGAARVAPLAPLPADKVDLQFDPFAWRDLILAKQALRRFGFCLYVEGYSFPTEGLSTAQILVAANKWCSTDPMRTPRYDNPLYSFAMAPVLPALMREGVLYRPKSTYNIVILTKTDGKSSGLPWQLYQTKRVEMPNASPILSIGINRALFTKRITTVHFSDGSLTDVAVDKDSEAVGFVQIPLVAVQAIVDVPGQIIKVRLADTQSHQALVEAQGNLLNAIASYQAAVTQNPGTASPGGLPRSANSRAGEFLGRCIDAYADPATCRRLLEESSR
jgi:hypothetical protein